MFALIAILSVSMADAHGVSPADSFANAVRSQSGTQAFAGAKRQADETLRTSTKSSLRQPHAHKEAIQSLPGTGGDEKGRAIQREVEAMVGRLRSLSDAEADIITNELEGVESSLASASTDAGLVKEITSIRAELCVNRGFKGTSLDACEAFMHKSCVTDALDTSTRSLTRWHGRASTVPEDECTKFFSEAKVGVKVAAPAPAAMVAPGPAPAPGPALFGGKMGRLLPEQGFDGPLVEHKDFDTHTEDWHKEFGPSSGHRSFQEICADHPHNEWCRLHGYHAETEAQEMRSAAYQGMKPLAAVIAIAAVHAWFAL